MELRLCEVNSPKAIQLVSATAETWSEASLTSIAPFAQGQTVGHFLIVLLGEGSLG